MKMIDSRPAVALAFLLAGCGEAADEPNSQAEPEVGVVAYVVPNAADPEAASISGSAFTELDLDRCRVIEENKAEGPYWRRRCSAPGNWRVEWSESDLRQDLTLISSEGRQTDLRLSDLVAEGAFNGLGETVEWRGDDPTKPEALIVRMNVANGVEPRLPDISRLAVVKLTGSPCLVAVVEPAANQNEKARAIADGPMPSCLTD
jgi:hypothetical protein